MGGPQPLNRLTDRQRTSSAMSSSRVTGLAGLELYSRAPEKLPAWFHTKFCIIDE